MEALPYCHDLGLLIHLFFYFLEGEPMEWFMSLSKEELSSFKRIQESILLKYQYKVEPKPTFLDLAKEMMEPSEDWFTYANRWRDMAARSGLEISERQMVQKLIANTTGPMKKGLANAYCPSVDTPFGLLH